MGDDALGVLLLRELRNRTKDRTGVEFFELATGGMNLLHILRDLDHALIIDACDFGGAPGDHILFRPGEVGSVKPIRGYSLHELDVMKVLELSKNLGEAPEEILIFAVQPASVVMREGLSRVIEEKMEDYIVYILDEIITRAPF